MVRSTQCLPARPVLESPDRQTSVPAVPLRRRQQTLASRDTTRDARCQTSAKEAPARHDGVIGGSSSSGTYDVCLRTSGWAEACRHPHGRPDNSRHQRATQSPFLVVRENCGEGLWRCSVFSGEHGSQYPGFARSPNNLRRWLLPTDYGPLTVVTRTASVPAISPATLLGNWGVRWRPGLHLAR